MKKEIVMMLLDELYDDVQSMREEGETDLRTVLHLIYETKMKITKSE
jgi:hypothetical protein